MLNLRICVGIFVYLSALLSCPSAKCSPQLYSVGERAESDPVAAALIVFIVKPASNATSKPLIYPINYDLLEGFTIRYGYNLVAVKDRRPLSEYQIGSFIRINRFANPYKTSKSSAIISDKGATVHFWEAPESYSLQHALEKLQTGGNFHVFSADEMELRSMYLPAWSRVPTGYDKRASARAHPDGEIPNIRSLPPSDILSPCR